MKNCLLALILSFASVLSAAAADESSASGASTLGPRAASTGVSSGISAASAGISLHAEPKNPVAHNALEWLRGHGTFSADEQYVTRLLSTRHLPFSKDELCGYTQVRSIQISEYGMDVFDYFPCTFHYESDELFFRKTGGSQRKAGTLYQEDEETVIFEGWWFFNGDKEVHDVEHGESGWIFKLSEHKVILLIDRDEKIEILEFTKPDAPSMLSFTDDSGYVYSFIYDEEDNEGLAVDVGGLYSGDVVIPQTIDVDDVTLYVTTMRRGAMWKKEGATNIGDITSVALPSGLWLIGADAFRDNPSLRIVSYDSMARIENRAFFGCPALELHPIEPGFAYTDPRVATAELEGCVMPQEDADTQRRYYYWAFFKERHTGISFRGLNGGEDDFACWASDINRAKGAQYRFRNTALVGELFRGYTKQHGHDLVLADNLYVGSHDFPAFSRWIFGEKKTSCPAAFADALAARYGREVAYSYEVGKVNSTGDQLCITEFKIQDGEARFVLSWLRDGQELCDYTQAVAVEDGNDGYSVWNVEDEGTYGIPHILTVAYDEDGNVDLFLMHSAPESRTYMHLRQNGDKLEKIQEQILYVLYD